MIYSFVYTISPILLYGYYISIPNLQFLGQAIDKVPMSPLFSGIPIVMLNIITEVYGYNEAKKTVYVGVIVHFMLTFIVLFASFINDSTSHNCIIHVYRYFNDNSYYLPKKWHQLGFEIIYIIISEISDSIFVLIFYILNANIIFKLKIATRSKLFFLRFIFVPIVPIMLFVILADISGSWFEIINGNSTPYIINVINSFTLKICTLIILSFPAFLVCNYLNKNEHLRVRE